MFFIKYANYKQEFDFYTAGVILSKNRRLCNFFNENFNTNRLIILLLADSYITYLSTPVIYRRSIDNGLFYFDKNLFDYEFEDETLFSAVVI